MNTPQAVLNRSAASKKRMSDPLARANHSEKMKMVWSDDEFKTLSLAKMQAGAADPEVITRRRDSLIKAYATPEMKAKMSAVNAEIGSRPEVVAARSMKSKNHWAENYDARTAAINRPDVKAKMSQPRKAWADPARGAQLRADRSTPEHRQKMAEAARRRATPEYRAMMAEKTRASWLKRKVAA